MTDNQNPDDHPDDHGGRVEAHDSATRTSDASWATFMDARRALGEVMTDDELRELGIDVEVLDSRP